MPDDNTMQSFALVRGDKDENGEWVWTSVIGDQERDGARYTFGIDPERTRSGAGVIQVYNGYLYIGEYNDEEVALEDLLLETSFDFFNENLRQSVNLYRMDADENIELVVGDPTEMFPDGGLSGIGSGFGRNENQYIWRMTEYEGKLYLGTFDTSSLLEPIGQFANGDINNMTPEEWESLIGFIRILIELRLSGGGDEGSEGSDTAPMDKLFADYDDETLAYVLRTGDISVLGIGTRGADLDPDMVRAYMLNETDTLPIGDISDLIELLGGLNGLMDTVRGTLTCAGYLADATRGFDMYVSEDGINFETITIDGFGDTYNHGLRVFAETDSGLTIGTANPFFGTQVWLMNEEESGDEHTVTFVDGVTGDTLGSAVIADGLTVGEELFPEAPEHDGYEFIGWDYDGSEVYSDLTITALYREVSGPMLGYVNEDGVIDTTDAVLALRCALMLIELEKPELADINGDGIVSIIDALAIIRIAMNIA